MSNVYEVEVRGPLTKEKFDKTVAFLEKEAEFVTDKNRVLIDYSTEMATEGLEGRQKDIRVRITNGVPEIIVKLGSWGGSDSRKELSAITQQGSFDTLVQIFAAMGYERGVLCVRNSKVFIYKDIEFAIVEVPGHSYYFEAELIIENRADSKAAQKRIQEVCEEINLTPFSDNEYFEYVRVLNEESNTIFDIANYTEGYFKEAFNLPE